MRRLPLLLFSLFALLALYETANALLGPRRVASDRDWESAARAVRQGYRPGDLIVFAPPWVDQVGRQHLGDLVTPEMAGRADADHYGRVWEVAVRGARAVEANGKQVAAGEHGRVAVRLIEKPALPPPSFDFTARLEEARVTQLPRDGRGDETPCYRDGAAFRCASTMVERRTLEVDYRPRRGILVPVDGALATRLEWPAASLGRSLVLYLGLHDYFARKNADGPVDVALLVDGQLRHQQRFEQRAGWLRHEIDTAALAGPHAVRLEVSAPAAAWRNLGLHLEARP